jgi:hypothetical protein
MALLYLVDMQSMQGMRLSLCVQTELSGSLALSKVGSLALSHTAGLFIY